ncbi:MAG: hypothetical protein ACYDCI_03605 [Candidatus Limnocylindrales bacterium]
MPITLSFPATPTQPPWVFRVIGYTSRGLDASLEEPAAKSQQAYTYALPDGLFEIDAPGAAGYGEPYWLLINGASTRRLSRNEASDLVRHSADYHITEEPPVDDRPQWWTRTGRAKEIADLANAWGEADGFTFAASYRVTKANARRLLNAIDVDGDRERVDPNLWMELSRPMTDRLVDAVIKTADPTLSEEDCRRLGDEHWADLAQAYEDGWDEIVGDELTRRARQLLGITDNEDESDRAEVERLQRLASEPRPLWSSATWRDRS